MYTTLARAKSELTAQSTVDDAKLLNYIGIVTRRMQGFGYDFEPQYAAKYFTADQWNTSAARGTFQLVNRAGAHMLLASSTDVPTITLSGVGYVYGTKVFAEPRGVTPIKTLRLNDADYTINDTWYPTTRQFLDSVVITGYWGYRENYETEGWLASGQTVLNAADVGLGETALARV